ncbi:MAG: hypothetical protein E1N59_2258 [Puniceicoccaceae bacterium 5H]|nr:MAG: hypothetical protein E1N59_2258 [Puniceicoccaceae bacterium 5H]
MHSPYPQHGPVQTARRRAHSPSQPSDEPSSTTTGELFRLARELALDSQQIQQVEALLYDSHQRRETIDAEWREGYSDGANEIWWQRLTELHRWVDQEIARFVRPEQYGTWRQRRELRLTLVGTHQISA